MRSLVKILCLLMAIPVASAQSDRGTITGTISDPAGAVIAGAFVEAKNVQTGAMYQTASTPTGNYTLAQLPNGQYQLTVSVPGFKQYLRQGIMVLVAQTLRIDVTPEVGAATETVMVTADAPMLKTESGEMSHNVSTERMDNLPVLGIGASASNAGIRNPYAAIQLVPGTLYQGDSYVRINGSPSGTQSIRIDGQDATNGMMNSGGSQTQPSVDAIEEFSLQTSNYAAEFGQAGGGLFNFTMKSGTNRFHGSVYEYFVNEALNAQQPFLNVKPRTRRNNYGFTAGGPVWIPKVYNGHDKTFFFVSFEQYREDVIANNVPQTVPTVAYRNGDFRQALTGRTLGTDPTGRPILEGTIYDPATERLVNGLRVRDPFPNNAIPQDRWDPVAAKIQALIPLPTTSDLINNYLSSWHNPRVTYIPALKVDHSLSPRSKLSFYWSMTDTNAIRALGPAGADGLPLPITAGRGTFATSHTTRMSFDQSLTPTKLLHVGVGYLQNYFNDNAEAQDVDQLKTLGLRGPTATIFPYLTGITAARGGMKAMGPLTQSDRTEIKPTANASLTWVKNNHTYKFGAEMRIEGYPMLNRSRANGSYTFAATETGQPSTLGQNLQGGTIGFPYASFLLGMVDSGNIAVITRTRLGKSAWGLFAQDTWKVTRRFTLDYGLRWDYQTYFREQYRRIANFSPAVSNPSAGGLPGGVIYEGNGPGRCNCDFAQVYPYAFGPRLGAAFRITPKTVFRAGFGISYSQTASENGNSSSMGSNNAFVSPSFGDPAMLLRDGPPAPAPWPALNPGLYPFPGTLTAPPIAIDRNAGRPARMIMWSIGLQREIFKNLVVEASYVGNRGAWWQANGLIDVNALTPERIASFGLDINSAADRSLLASRLDSALAAQRKFNKLPYPNFPTSSTVAQSLRPFPQFGTVSYLWAPLGRTWYDSLQAKVIKRFSHGLDFSSTFTWQKELTMGSESETAGQGIPGSASNLPSAVNNVFDRKTNKYISGFSRPFVSSVALNYTLPKFGGNQVLSWAVRDWQFGAVLQYASGLPILAPVAQSQLATLLFRNTYANRVPGVPLFVKDLNCHCIDPNKEFVLNPQAWVDPPAGRYGTSAAYYNDYRYERRPSEALSLGRLFRLREGMTLSIRAEFINAFNRTYMSNPDSTNAKATQTVNPSTGQVISGFGRINTGSVASVPRNGTIVVRLLF